MEEKGKLVCPRCGSVRYWKKGHNMYGKQVWVCGDCKRTVTEKSEKKGEEKS